MNYTFHHDDGHGWLEVPFADLMNVGLTLSKISTYSYATVNAAYVPTVYLEEDIDVAIFMLAAKRAGKKVTFTHKDVPGSSVIRSYPRNTKGKQFESGELRMLMQACEIEGVFA
jgi:hypothetical protein